MEKAEYHLIVTYADGTEFGERAINDSYTAAGAFMDCRDKYDAGMIISLYKGDASKPILQGRGKKK